MTFWQIALAIWFLLYGIVALTNIRVAFTGPVMGVLALAVCVLLFVRK